MRHFAQRRHRTIVVNVVGGANEHAHAPAWHAVSLHKALIKQETQVIVGLCQDGDVRLHLACNVKQPVERQAQPAAQFLTDINEPHLASRVAEIAKVWMTGFNLSLAIPRGNADSVALRDQKPAEDSGIDFPVACEARRDKKSGFRFRHQNLVRGMAPHLRAQFRASRPRQKRGSDSGTRS